MTGAASVVNGKRFSSGRQLEEYTKQLMQEVGSTDDLKAANPTAFRFMWDLFQRHPRPQEKKLESVRRVAIGPTRWATDYVAGVCRRKPSCDQRSGVLFSEAKTSPRGTSRNERLAPASVPRVCWPCFC